MASTPLDLLFTLNASYIQPLQVALYSIRVNHPQQAIRIWLVHESLSPEEIRSLEEVCQLLDFSFHPIQVDGSRWQSAKTAKRYPKEMYFRLLAGEILPTTLDRVLYLDPDILVINSLLDLWQLDLKDHVFAAASHTGLTDASTRINQLRLDMDHAYFNSGVLLINLTQARLKIHWADIQDTLDKYNNFLLLPDQDVLNYLYGKYTLEIPEEIWNYDARKYLRYLARSMNRHDIHWVLDHTSVLHFCGQPKPWQEEHDNRFTGLYLDYQKRIDQLLKNNTKKQFN